jgi:hypothetical protein
MDHRYRARAEVARLTALAQKIEDQISRSRLLIARSRKMPDDGPAHAADEAPSWRFRILAHALGSDRRNATDLSDADRQILHGVDRELQRCEASLGEKAAEEMFLDILRILEEAEPTRH